MPEYKDPEKLKRRLLSKVTIDSESGCRLFTGVPHRSSGYGRMEE